MAAPRRPTLEQDRRWVAAGGVVFDGQGRVALVLQRGRSSNLRWTFPKGRVEPGESHEGAALREVTEETGLAVRVERYLGVHHGSRRVIHYFAMGALSLIGPYDGETLALRFVAPAEAASLLGSRRDLKVLVWATRSVGRSTRSGDSGWSPGHRSGR